MPLLPVTVPDIPETRSEVVAARLARKVAPLFGVPWAGSPFDMTWVCDYTTVTLSEIARGAPQAARADHPRSDAPWTLTGRAVATTGRLPNEIAAATLNRFGPDTKAAVVLTAVNLLFEPVTAAITQAVTVLDRECGDLPTRLRLAGWAAMVLEAFRSQPALFVAGIQARAIQRAALTQWRLPLAGAEVARCEIGAPRTGTWQAGTATSPDSLDITDATIRAVRLPAAGDSTAAHAPEFAERWLRKLAAMGTTDGDGYLWLSERRPGHRVVESYIPHTPAISAYLDDITALLCGDTTETRLPSIPDPSRLNTLSPMAKRALVLALITMVRQVRFDPRHRENTRATLLDTLATLTTLAEECLGHDDAVTAITRCRTADIRVQTLRHNLSNTMRTPIRQLTDALDDCRKHLADGELDRGDLAELIYSSNVEINVVLRHNMTKGPGAKTTATLLRDSWAEFLALTDIDTTRLSGMDVEARTQAGFHLSAYASYLAGRDDTTDLRLAVDIFRDLVLPAREQRHRRTGLFQPFRQSLQTATRATSELALRAHNTGNPAEAQNWADLGRHWITLALADEHTRRLITTPTEPACHFALLAARALLTAAHVGSPTTTQADIDTSETLLDLARSFADAITHGGGQYARQADIDHIENLLATARSTSFPVRHHDM
jgi:hypothetical protein